MVRLRHHGVPEGAALGRSKVRASPRRSATLVLRSGRQGVELWLPCSCRDVVGAGAIQGRGEAAASGVVAAAAPAAAVAADREVCTRRRDETLCWLAAASFGSSSLSSSNVAPAIRGTPTAGAFNPTNHVVIDFSGRLRRGGRVLSVNSP